MVIRSVKDKKDKEAKQKVRKVLVEFLVHFLFTIIRYGTQYAVFLEALDFDAKIRLHVSKNVQRVGLNTTKTIDYCTLNSWKGENILEKITYFRGVAYTYGFFAVGSAVVAVIHILLWLVFLYRTQKDPEYPETDGTKFANLLRRRLSFIENVIHDMPLSVLAVSIFTARVGKNGLVCLMCAVSPYCSDSKDLTKMILPASAALAASLCIITMSTTWRAISVFFQWSYTRECPLVPVRGCASIVFGLIYSVLILTPALFTIKYQLFALPGIANKAGGILGLIDKLTIVAIIAWMLIISAACCCPLMRAIS